MKKQFQTDLVPVGGTKYEDAKNAAQQLANIDKEPKNLWFNVSKGGKPEIINPETT